MSIAGISKIGLEAWCLLASVAAHALFVAVVLALPAAAQPDVAEEERVSVEVITPEELQEIIDEARLQPQQRPEPEPELDPSVLEPRPEPEVNVEKEAEEDAEAKAADATKPDAEQKPETNDAETAELTAPKTPEPETPEQEKPEPVKPRTAPSGPAAIGPKSDAEPGPTARAAPTIPTPGRPIVIPRKRVAPEEDKVLVGDRKRETLCHDTAKSEIIKSRPELKPDLVISSAIVPSEGAANTIVANGAAFRSENRWYNFKFRCEADPFQEKLIAFDFLIGPAFPEGEVVEVKVTAEE